MALILILENEPVIALDIESVLDEAGYRQHVTLATCAEAVDWLNENNPQMAIVDPRLSDGVAATVVRLLVERETPFVVYSGEPNSVAEIEPFFAAGELLMKPCMPGEIVAAVDRALNDRRSNPGSE
jgi:DNA-binding response OmpR family regulator